MWERFFMSIYIDDEQLLFHLQGKETSYVMQVVQDNYLAHLYWEKNTLLSWK